MVACSDSKKEPTTNVIEKENREIKVNNSDRELIVEFFIEIEDVPQKAKWVQCFTNNSSSNYNNENIDENTKNGKKDTSNKNNKNDFTVEEAIKIAKDKYGVDEDTEYYYDTTGMKYENGKRYYNITPKSKSMMKNGGSGTLFRIKVFEDKTIIQQ